MAGEYLGGMRGRKLAVFNLCRAAALPERSYGGVALLPSTMLCERGPRNEALLACARIRPRQQAKVGEHAPLCMCMHQSAAPMPCTVDMQRMGSGRPTAEGGAFMRLCAAAGREVLCANSAAAC